MIEISQIRLRCGENPKDQLRPQIRRVLRLSRDEDFTYRIVRHAVDARKKPELYDVYSVRVAPARNFRLPEEKLAERLHSRNVRIVREVPYVFPGPEEGACVLPHRPVVVGFGPAGIFCALMLARAGYRPVIFERGQRMEERVASVSSFWAGGALNPDSNIQFGEGGAGTFSDGKLNSNIKDPTERISAVLSAFVGAGAPEDILYEQIPHIGTDRLRDVIRNIRMEILSLGGEIRFDTRVTALCVCGGKVCGIRYRPSGAPPLVPDEYLPCEALVLAPGHSARDTIRSLHAQGIPMSAKPFAVGLRVSHPQSLINFSQYGISDPEEMRRLRLAPANYKLTAQTEDARGIYSFCMCPGGYVVNASSESGRLAVNGMSNYLRDSGRANSAIVMSVGERDFPKGDPVLAGMSFQEQLEEKAYRLCGGRVPVQRFASFEKKEIDARIPSEEELCIRGAASPGALHTLLPEGLTKSFVSGMHEFGRRIHGFDGEEAYVIGLESRTSSPVRILRDASGESAVEGLFPCGEGAGYAGGITSAAVDGIRAAECIASRFRPPADGS